MLSCNLGLFMNHEEQADKMEQFDIRNVHGHFEGKKITYIFFLVTIYLVLIKYLYGMSLLLAALEVSVHESKHTQHGK